MSEFDNMVTFVKVANKAKGFIVACMYGAAGIGKTAAVNQAAAELASEGKATGKVVTIIASQILPNEVSGITMPVHETKAMEIYDHYRLSSLKDGDILFFDELLEADQLVLSACLTLIESRAMMSGKKLPDIQVVAATNATIKPNMLKENIRQRFVWRKFSIDKVGTAEYIKKAYGLDVTRLVDKIVETGDEYNILTPRSLTKMAGWICCAKDEAEANEIAGQINLVWCSSLGKELLEAWIEMHYKPAEQVRCAIADTIRFTSLSDDLKARVFDKELFDNTSIIELMETLKQLEEWPEIERKLSSIEIVEANITSDVSF